MRFICLTTMTVLLLAAQDKPVEPDPIIKNFVELKYLKDDASRLRRVIEVVRQLNAGQVDVIYDPELKVLALRGRARAINEAETLLKRFDVPAEEHRVRQIEVTIYLIEASSESSPDQPVPAALKSALDQLRTAFGYKGYRLMDTILLQGRERSDLNLSGLLPMEATKSSDKTFYTASYKNINYVESQKSVEITHFHFNIRIPLPGTGLAAQTSYGDSGIETDLTIKDGQKLVLGKLARDQTERGVFLVLTTKVD
jgi:hypothetical protein